MNISSGISICIFSSVTSPHSQFVTGRVTVLFVVTGFFMTYWVTLFVSTDHLSKAVIIPRLY